MGKQGNLSFHQKLGHNARRMRRRTVVQGIPEPAFLKLMPNAMNWSNQLLNHLLQKLPTTVRNSVTKRSQHYFRPRFFHSHLVNPTNLLWHSVTYDLDKHSSIFKIFKTKKNKIRGLSPLANYTD
jgi:hypothetical protein